MNWIKPGLRLSAPLKIYSNVINPPNTRIANPSVLTGQHLNLNPATDHELKFLQGPMNHLQDIFPELPALQD